MPNRVTMADVAREAGVSLMTVSRVVNNKGEVSPETRRRVQYVIERLGYRPSGIARSLATKRTGTIGLVVPDNANPFFSEVARAAQQTAYAKGYNIFLGNTDEDPERELDVLRSFEEKRVDGVLLCSSRLDDAALHAAIERHSAVVLVNRRLNNGTPVSVVRIDDEEGGRTATEHLLHAGHRAVGFLAGPPTSYSGQQRRVGYCRALEDAGVVYNPAFVQNCVPNVRGGQEAASSLLTTHPELTALFCYNDLLAVGASQACEKLEIRIPEALAIVGFDDIPLASLVTPALTTCRVPRDELGGHAMRLLLDQIDGYRVEPDEILVPPQLVIRASAP